MTALMNIGDAAKAAGVSAKMIRHYEQTGLLPEAERSESGYRLYSEREISVLRFIRQSRRLGFSMPQIAELIGQWGDSHRSSRQVKAIAEERGVQMPSFGGYLLWSGAVLLPLLGMERSLLGIGLLYALAGVVLLVATSTPRRGCAVFGAMAAISLTTRRSSIVSGHRLSDRIQC